MSRAAQSPGATALQAPAVEGSTKAGLRSWAGFPWPDPLPVPTGRLCVWMGSPEELDCLLAPRNILLLTRVAPRSVGALEVKLLLGTSADRFVLLLILFIIFPPSFQSPSCFLSFRWIIQIAKPKLLPACQVLLFPSSSLLKASVAAPSFMEGFHEGCSKGPGTAVSGLWATSGTPLCPPRVSAGKSGCRKLYGR